MALLAVLHSRPFRLLWAGNTLNTLVENAQTVVMSAIVLKLTERPSDWGLVLASEATVRALLMPLGGMVADRFRPRRTLVAAHLLRALILVGMVAVARGVPFTLPVMMAYGVFFGASRALFLPAANAAIPSLVPPARLQNANAVQALTNTGVTFLGPLLAGLLLPQLEASGLFVAGALICLLAASLTLAMGPADEIADGSVASPHSTKEGPVAQLAAGLQAARRDRVVLPILILASLGSFGYAGAVVVGVPLLASFVLGAGEQVVGFLLGAVGGGALLGTMGSALWRPWRPGRAVFLALLLTGLAVGATGFVTSLAALLLTLALAGAGLAVALVLAITLVQSRTQPALQGRIISLLMLGIFGLTPAAYLSGGFVGNLVGPRNLIILFSVCIVGAGLLGLLNRSVAGASDEGAREAESA